MLYYTVTSANGGYALPLTLADGTTASGSVTVHMALLDGSTRDSIVTGGTVNVKWDAVVDPPSTGSTGATPTLSGGGPVSRSAKTKAVVLVTRPVGSDSAQPLEVALSCKGTAVAGVDYKALPGTVTIPAGATSCKLKVKALGGDGSGDVVTLAIKVKGQKGARGKVTVTFVP